MTRPAVSPLNNRRGHAPIPLLVPRNSQWRSVHGARTIQRNRPELPDADSIGKGTGRTRPRVASVAASNRYRLAHRRREGRSLEALGCLPCYAALLHRRRLKRPKGGLYFGNRGIIIKTMQRRTTLRSVSDFDFSALVVVGERISPSADCHPQDIRQAPIVLFDFYRTRFTTPDDSAEQSQCYPFHFEGMMLGATHDAFGIPHLLEVSVLKIDSDRAAVDAARGAWQSRRAQDYFLGVFFAGFAEP